MTRWTRGIRSSANPSHLVDSPVVQFDGAQGPCREAAGLELAAIRRLLAVRVQVLPQVYEVLAAGSTKGGNRAAAQTHRHTEASGRPGESQQSPVVTVVTLEGALLAVPEADVVAQRGGQRAGHVTQGALVVVHWAKNEEKRHPQSRAEHTAHRAGSRGLHSPWFLMWSRSSLSVANLLEQWEHWNLCSAAAGQGGDRRGQGRGNSTGSSEERGYRSWKPWCAALGSHRRNSL